MSGFPGIVVRGPSSSDGEVNWEGAEKGLPEVSLEAAPRRPKKQVVSEKA